MKSFRHSAWHIAKAQYIKSSRYFITCGERQGSTAVKIVALFGTQSWGHWLPTVTLGKSTSLCFGFLTCTKTLISTCKELRKEPGTLQVLNKCCLLIFLLLPWFIPHNNQHSMCCDVHFMDKKTEAPRGEVAAYIAPNSQYKEVLDLKDRPLHLYPAQADSRA